MDHHQKTFHGDPYGYILNLCLNGKKDTDSIYIHMDQYQITFDGDLYGYILNLCLNVKNFLLIKPI